ncbi:MAG: response regulator, partial [Paludibacterium sp.]|uniref:ATP-binding response regulator n=1 Tax=Paludibacterium sp. TaxID=1917523 RepID=UPI0025CC7814
MLNYNTSFLVVDDFEAMRKVTANQVRSLGFENVHVASNGAEALRILHSRKIDIILSDWNMPILSGLELLKAVRVDDKLQHLPFIMITAEAERHRIEEAIASGVSNLLVKPYTAERLHTRVEKALRWRPVQKAPGFDKPASDEREQAPPPPADPVIGLPAPRPPVRPTVLVVDDTPDNLQLLTHLFKDDYRVRLADSGTRALEICCSDTPPDLVLLDVMMPDIDGFEVAKRLSEHPATAGLPIIFVTAMDGDAAHLNGLELGAVDYVTKPIQPELLKARVRNFLRYVSLHRQLQADYDQMVELARLKEQGEQITHHDMKGPLAGVIGLLQAVLDDGSLGRRAVEQLRLAEGAAFQLLNMVNLSAELYKIETGSFELKPQAIDIGDVLRHMAEMLRHTFAAKELAIAVDADVPVGEEPPRALGDPTLCYAVFYNLIKNACEAAPAHSRVNIVLYGTTPLRVGIENKGAVPAAIRARFF